MSQLEKAIERLKSRPPEASFDDVRRVLEAHGWRQARQKGSHVSFVKPGEFTLTVPLRTSDRVKRPYVDEICRRLELDD